MSTSRLASLSSGPTLLAQAIGPSTLSAGVCLILEALGQQVEEKLENPGPLSITKFYDREKKKILVFQQLKKIKTK